MNGSYTGMIRLLWLTHFVILLLFIAILRRAEFPIGSVCIAVTTVGLAWSNIETLGWATQWSALLSTLFLMFGWVTLHEVSLKRVIVSIVASLLSALCFSRGILAGPVLAGYLLLWREHPHKPKRIVWYVSLLLLPSILFLVQYHHLVSTHTNLRDLNGGKLISMVSWALQYELLNPLYHLISVAHRAVDLRAVVFYGVLKFSVIVGGLYFATRSQRRVIWSLLLLDFGTAALLAVGRYHTGATGLISFRYQYIPLLPFGTCLATVLHSATRSLKKPRHRHASVILSIVFWFALLGYPWKRHIVRWSDSRGVQVRHALPSTADDKRFGLPSITAGRARELMREYNLH